MTLSFGDVIFYLVAALMLLSAGFAVFTRNIVRAVFALLATFFCMAILYAMLSADFVAVVQVLVYVGGILVLLLFAVMLTTNIESARGSNPASGFWLGLLAAAGAAVVLVPLALKAPWHTANELSVPLPSTEEIGSRLLGEQLIAFEAVSVVLLGVVIGAIVLARFRHSADEGTEVKR